ncbi:hypothetical protein KP78_03650 [Jeotgalibacillus soli]|uniref:Uncharacterized protein n=1 Tax=Jeotgalibacillus soli TaxID=889306 RepID=A0A0C2W614_9BACL|nr:hypothetical protein KP78_03650 [Jeotgalibacillus soli]
MNKFTPTTTLKTVLQAMVVIELKRSLNKCRDLYNVLYKNPPIKECTTKTPTKKICM